MIGSQPAADLQAPLAKVDGVVITVGELQERLNRMSPYIRARYTSLEQKKEFLDSLIRFEVLAEEAQRRGFNNDPEVVRTMKQVMIQKLMTDEFEVKLTPDSITDADIKAYYDGHLDEFVKPEEVRAAAIVLKSKDQAQRVATEAGGEEGQTNKGFRDLVAKYSTDDDSKLRGGDLRWMDADNKDVPAPVVTAAFALVNTGDVSGVIDDGKGSFWILKQTGRRKAQTRSLDEASQQIRNKLYREKRVDAQKNFIDALRAKSKIEVDEDNLAKVRIDTSAQSGDAHYDSQPLPDFSSPPPAPTPPDPPPLVAPEPPERAPAPAAPGASGKTP
ncbi:MAG TPA: peptidyl-prolyl cis-trans isomerase [Kofleriaceae bacterium]|nr:peptidyl-prolyl cis-trans isomerase [Kofleriaceae bacterium]